MHVGVRLQVPVAAPEPLGEGEGVPTAAIIERE